MTNIYKIHGKEAGNPIITTQMKIDAKKVFEHNLKMRLVKIYKL